MIDLIERILLVITVVTFIIALSDTKYSNLSIYYNTKSKLEITTAFAILLLIVHVIKH